jgi:hypothetical protein
MIQAPGFAYAPIDIDENIVSASIGKKIIWANGIAPFQICLSVVKSIKLFFY